MQKIMWLAVEALSDEERKRIRTGKSMVAEVIAKIGRKFLTVDNIKFLLENERDENGSIYHLQKSDYGSANFRLYDSEIGANLYRSRIETLNRLNKKNLTSVLKELPLSDLLKIEATVNEFLSERGEKL